MASAQTISEFNGAGQTETTSRTENNWKRVDDSTTAWSSSPINASNTEFSFGKYQAVKFTVGTGWNSISAVTVKIDNNAPATGLSIVGAVVTAYTTPATTATGDGAMSTSGATVNLVSSSSAFGAGTSSSTSGATIYTQALRTQLQTAPTYTTPGDIVSRTITWSWTES